MKSYPVITNRKIRVAIVGCGRISKNHFGSLEKHQDNIELIAIGIGHDVSRYYKKAVTIMDVDELGEVLLNELSNIFTTKKKIEIVA